MPQIEVTFDIDANGIVKVSAKDLGTGKENGDKLPADVKSEAESKLSDLKNALQSGSIDDIKSKQDALSQVFERMYQAAAAAQQAAGAASGPDTGSNGGSSKPNDDGVVDADFKEV